MNYGNIPEEHIFIVCDDDRMYNTHIVPMTSVSFGPSENGSTYFRALSHDGPSKPMTIHDCQPSDFQNAAKEAVMISGTSWLNLTRSNIKRMRAAVAKLQQS